MYMVTQDKMLAIKNCYVKPLLLLALALCFAVAKGGCGSSVGRARNSG